MTEQLPPPPRDKESSKSWKQARMMLEQSNPELPEGMKRRCPADVAARFRDNDIRAAQSPDQDVRDRAFYDEFGVLKPNPNPEPPPEAA